MYLRVHEGQQGRIVAVCDRMLLGRVFREGERVLDLKKYKAFYNGRRASEKEVEEALQEFGSANLVGEKAVGLAVQMGLADTDDAQRVANVPHLQIYRM